MYRLIYAVIMHQQLVQLLFSYFLYFFTKKARKVLEKYLDNFLMIQLKTENNYIIATMLSFSSLMLTN
jgi:hypothetical protein